MAYAWVVLLTKMGVDPLVSGLVQKGYTVGPLAEEGILFWESPIGTATLSLNLSKPNAEFKAVYEDIQEALKERKLSYLSLVVTPSVSAIWNGKGESFTEHPKTSEPTLWDRLDEQNKPEDNA